MKKDYRLYNMVFPPFFAFLLTPWFTAVAIVADFIIDSVILIILTRFFFKSFDWRFYLNRIWIVWVFGFLADVIGWVVLFLMLMMVEEFGAIHVISGIIVASVLIFVLNYFISFSETAFTKKQRVIAALTYAIVTAPYTFLLPSEWFF